MLELLLQKLRLQPLGLGHGLAAASTHLYCCRGSSFPVLVSQSLEASTRTMLRKRKKFTCQQMPTVGLSPAGTRPSNRKQAALGGSQALFPGKGWEVELWGSHHDSSQDGDLINPLHVPRAEVPAPEESGEEPLEMPAGTGENCWLMVPVPPSHRPHLPSSHPSPLCHLQVSLAGRNPEFG